MLRDVCVIPWRLLQIFHRTGKLISDALIVTAKLVSHVWPLFIL